MYRLSPCVAGPQRRAAVAIQTGISLVLLLSATALTIDLGRLYTGRTELQTAADSSALAGASAYMSNSALRLAIGPSNGDLISLVHSTVLDRANSYAEQNYTLHTRTHLMGADIIQGHYNFANPGAGLDTSNPATFNAVQVTARRTNTSPDGPIPYFFAPIFGPDDGQVKASAIAAMDDRFAGFQQQENGLLIPFVIQQNAYQAALTGGADEFSYNESSDAVAASADGVREIKLFPWQSGGGNFGILNVGIANQGTPPEAVQIQNGIQPSSLELEIGTSNVVFYNSSGDPITYSITGSPGISNGLVPAIQSRIGDVVGFFLYSTAVQQGSNRIYTITGLRFGRVVALVATGALNNRRLVIQPVVVVDSSVTTGPNAPSSNGLVGRLVLVK